MFAVVRTGGKQYRVAADQKIIVDRMPGEAGDSVILSDVLLLGTGAEVSAAAGQTVAAEIVAQTKGDKIIVFKKKRRHNYRRKNGHRQQLTVLKILAIGGEAAPKKAAKAKAAPAVDAAPVVEAATEAAAPKAKRAAKPKAAPAASAE